LAIVSGAVIPFPLTRRRGFARKHAGIMAGYSQVGAERYLQAQLQRQRQTMQRRGIKPERIEAELRALECALRVELRALGLCGGVA
jgi:hypothetical protein